MSVKKQPNDGGFSVLRLANYIAEFAVMPVIFALVFTTFIARTYGIPTGSMGPTLLGYNREHRCRDCGYRFVYGVEDASPEPGIQLRLPKQLVCPNCRFAEPPDPRLLRKSPRVRGGDYLVANKLGYELAAVAPVLQGHLGPQRWEVVIIKDPSDASINYIKRLVGLPGEKIEIIDGDLFVNDRIPEKTADAQQSLWFLVNDIDHQPRGLPRRASLAAPRWQAADDAAAKIWTTSGRVLRFDAADADSPAAIRFAGPVQDFYAYDDADTQNGNLHTVSDLKMEFVLVPGRVNPQGRVSLTLSKRDDVFTAVITADGAVSLERRSRQAMEQGQGQPQRLAEAKIDPLTTDEPRVIGFENVDHRVRLFVDGRTVLTTTPQQYQADPQAIKKAGREPAAPIVNVSVAGLDGQIRHMKLFRDVYYQYAQFHPSMIGVDRALVNKPGHGVAGNPIHLQDDEYFVLGDNSPRSKDSRLWTSLGPHLQPPYDTGRHTLGAVPADQMIGRAIFVFWPAPGRLFGSLPAIVPNVGDMRLVR
ncbi:MAG: signal peptidase I [Phycisphaerae bacterium]|nr:signal peptidase I [Phycisphaerae bacterium]